MVGRLRKRGGVRRRTRHTITPLFIGHSRRRKVSTRIPIGRAWATRRSGQRFRKRHQGRGYGSCLQAVKQKEERSYGHTKGLDAPAPRLTLLRTIGGSCRCELLG